MFCQVPVIHISSALQLPRQNSILPSLGNKRSASFPLTKRPWGNKLLLAEIIKVAPLRLQGVVKYCYSFKSGLFNLQCYSLFLNFELQVWQYY